MGLDIRWHRGLIKAKGNEGFDERGEPRHDDGWFQLFVNYDFPGRADEIEDGLCYRSKESGAFCAGSYSGYSHWRNQLAELAGYEGAPYAAGAWNKEGGPFWELINFSDCEGVIGGKACKKLANDFSLFQGKADGHKDMYFREKYREWRNCFEKAADSGAVVFC